METFHFIRKVGELILLRCENNIKDQKFLSDYGNVSFVVKDVKKQIYESSLNDSFIGHCGRCVSL
jgi:hypothetical protein